MTTRQASDKLKGVATVWQLVVSISTTVIAILIYILSIRYDVNANSKKIETNVQEIKEVKSDFKQFTDKEDVRLQQILDAINDLKLSLKDKADRR